MCWLTGSQNRNKKACRAGEGTKGREGGGKGASRDLLILRVLRISDQRHGDPIYTREYC